MNRGRENNNRIFTSNKTSNYMIFTVFIRKEFCLLLLIKYKINEALIIINFINYLIILLF